MQPTKNHKVLNSLEFFFKKFHRFEKIYEDSRFFQNNNNLICNLHVFVICLREIIILLSIDIY